MASINTQVKRVSGLLDTKDLSDWEQDFVELDGKSQTVAQWAREWGMKYSQAYTKLQKHFSA